MGKFFYQHMEDDPVFAAEIHAITCGCKDGKCGRLGAPKPVLTPDDFQESV